MRYKHAQFIIFLSNYAIYSFLSVAIRLCDNNEVKSKLILLYVNVRRDLTFSVRMRVPSDCLGPRRRGPCPARPGRCPSPYRSCIRSTLPWGRSSYRWSRIILIGLLWHSRWHKKEANCGVLPQYTTVNEVTLLFIFYFFFIISRWPFGSIAYLVFDI